MRDKHPVFDDNIDPNTTIWRYFDFPKFTSLLIDQALYFSRANLLGDPLEGSFTRAREAERQSLLKNPPDGQTRDQLKKIFQHNARISASMPNSTYINCWHLGDHESMAMWGGYGGGPYGIAIRSTFRILDEIIPSQIKGANFEGTHVEDPIYIGRVKYVDYSSEIEKIPDEFNCFAPFMCKALAYKHETEVRAVFNSPSYMFKNDSPRGLFIDVDIKTLVQSIVISPLAPEWFKSVIENMCTKFGFSFQVEQSNISTLPIY